MRHPAVDASIKAVVKVVHRGICPALGFLSARASRRIIVYHAYPDFARKCDAIADLLRRSGLPADVWSGTSVFRRAQAKSSADLWIGFWNEYPRDSLPKNYIFFNAEPLHVNRWGLDEAWMASMRGAVEVWDYNPRNADALSPLGVPIRYVPFGYAPHYEVAFRRSTEGKTIAQDIDVLFVGTLSARRSQILERIRERGINVHVVTRSNPAYGAQLDLLLARSKILLGLHAFSEPEAQIPDLARLDHAIANRIFVIHERPAGGDDYPGFAENVTTSEYEDIPTICAELLSKAEERRHRADRAYEWFRAEYALEAYIPYRSLHEHLQRLSER